MGYNPVLLSFAASIILALDMETSFAWRLGPFGQPHCLSPLGLLYQDCCPLGSLNAVLEAGSPGHRCRTSAV